MNLIPNPFKQGHARMGQGDEYEVDMVMAKVMDACRLECLDYKKILNTSQKVHAWIDQRVW
jgi:hypothetical protein